MSLLLLLLLLLVEATLDLRDGLPEVQSHVCSMEEIIECLSLIVDICACFSDIIRVHQRHCATHVGEILLALFDLLLRLVAHCRALRWFEVACLEELMIRSRVVSGREKVVGGESRWLLAVGGRRKEV